MKNLLIYFQRFILRYHLGSLTETLSFTLIIWKFRKDYYTKTQAFSSCTIVIDVDIVMNVKVKPLTYNPQFDGLRFCAVLL